MQTDQSGGYYHLFKAGIYREFLIFVRYPVDAIAAIVMGVVFFSLIFFGGQLLVGQAITESIEGLIVGYFLWMLSVGSYAGIADGIQNEASWGTLERHYLSPFGFGPILLVKCVALVLQSFLVSAVVLAFMLLVSGTTLELPLVTVVVVGTLALASVFGIALAMGGLAVLYKRIGTLSSLLQFALVAFISAPAIGEGWTAILPLAQGSAMLQRTMREGVRLWEFEAVDLGILVSVALLYLALGYGIFLLSTNRARKLGVLGDY